MQKASDILNNLDMTALTQSFQSACSDKEFKEFVYGLKIEEEILMKYTSSLEDAFLECKNCKKCPGLLECKNKVPGFVYTPIKDNNIINFSLSIFPPGINTELKKSLFFSCLPKHSKYI